MKKVLLSFSVIGALALFATFTRKNVGEGVNSYLAPGVPILPASPAKDPVYVPKREIIPKPVGQYKDGSYNGPVADAYYGYIQVRVVIKNGKLSDVIFLEYPSDRRTSIEINTQAMPILKSEAIQIQSGNVDIVSGATDSSIAFRESMNVALENAKN